MKCKSENAYIAFRAFNRYVMHPTFIIMLSFIFFNISTGQLFGQVDSVTLKLISETPDENGKETGAVIILKDYQMTVNKEGQTRLVLRVLGKVYSKEALLDYSQVPLGYNSYYEEPALNYARVIHKNGTVREVPKDAIQIKTTPEQEGLSYTDRMYLSFALPGMETGAVFDYQVTINQKRSQIEGEWFENHWFAGMLQKLSPPYVPRIDPVMTSRYTLLVPAGTRFQYYLTLNPVKPAKRSINDQDEYTWIFSNLQPITIEDAMPELSKLSPVLLISSLEDWSQVDQWATKTILSKVEITREISEKANELTSGISDNDEKIKSICDFIQNNIQYIYADIDRGGFTPHTPNEILSSRYGDCKDQTILLISMLKALKIESFPALINPYPYPDYTSIPNPFFSHVITNIPGKKGDKWLDMTTGVTPFPHIFYANQGRTAFIINGKGGKLVKTPDFIASENISTFDLQASYDSGDVSVTMELAATGAQNDLLKSVFKSIDAESREQFLRQMITSYFHEANIDSISLSDIQDPEHYFSASVEYHLDSAWNKGQEGITFGSHALIPLGLLANVNTQSFPPKRHNDMVQIYSYTIKGSERYITPETDLLPVVIPQNDSIKNEFFSFRQNFKRDGIITLVDWTLTCNSSTVPKEKYESYLNFTKSLNEMISWSIDYVEPASYANQIIRTERPEDILNFCNKVLGQDSKNILALLLRGQVYFRLRQLDQSIEDFLQVIKLLPENKYAYVWIAYPLMLKNIPALALRYLNHAIRLDPEFADAYHARGIYYANGALFEKALADLNKALKVNPGHVNAMRLRGVMLSKLGKYPEAVASLQEALEIDSANSMIYSGLAETYMEMNLYRESIEMYLKAIELNPTDYNNYGNLGWAFYMANNDQKSIEYSQKAVALNPSGFYAKFNVALANLRSGNIGEARKLYSDLKGQSVSITESEWKGAVSDLNDLMAKGIYVKEIKEILREFFGHIF